LSEDNDIVFNNDFQIPDDNNIQLDNDISNYPPKILDTLSQEQANEYDFPIYNIDQNENKEGHVNDINKNLDIIDSDNISMNTRLDITYVPIDSKPNMTKSSEKNIKISIEDIPKLMPNENIKTIEINNGVKNIEINDGININPEEIPREKKLTVQKSSNIATKRDIKKNYSFF
jgi:hypothetical protein